MKRAKESHRTRHSEHLKTSFRDKNGIFLHPTLSQTQMRDIDEQIAILENQLKIVANKHYWIEKNWEGRLAEEADITLNISFLIEEQSRMYESFGQPAAALDSLVDASTRLFDRHCSILNSLMGLESPHAARLLLLDKRCKKLCHKYPELWPKYRRSNMKYLLAEQHLWPCE